FRPAGERVKAVPLRWSLAAIAILAVGLPGALWAARNTLTRVEEAGDLQTAGNLVILEPEKWIGKQIPLLAHIDIGEQLRTGKWILVLYHHDCSDCRAAVPRLVEVSKDFVDVRLGLVAVPPFAPPGEDIVGPTGPYVLGRLSAQREWFVQTPAIMLLDQ